MRIVAYGLPDRLNSALKKSFGKSVSIIPRPLSSRTVSKNTEIAVVTISSKITADSLKKMPKLQCIVTASTGIDHIDRAYCDKAGISVKNCATYSSNAVAELAVALSFAGLRNLDRMLGFGRSLAYPPVCFYYLGSELSDKKCAVLGTGSIGSLIAKKLIGLGCNVTAYSRTENQELVSLGVKYLQFEKALKESDILFIALPSTPQTFHLFGQKQLAMMKKGAAIVNIARGEIIDSAALLKYVDRLSFVATDVVEGEAALWIGKPMKVHSVSALSKKKNFLLVPHIGSSTTEAQARLAAETIDAIRSCILSSGRS